MGKFERKQCEHSQVPFALRRVARPVWMRPQGPQVRGGGWRVLNRMVPYNDNNKTLKGQPCSAQKHFVVACNHSSFEGRGGQHQTKHNFQFSHMFFIQ